MLEQFTTYWLDNRPLTMTEDVYSKVGDNTGAVLFRKEQYQVQLFICDPNSEIFDHIHPNIDSYEVYLGGDINFRIHGNFLTTEESIASNMRQRVKPNDWHGASIGKRGGSFISIQHWLNNIPPTSVHHDWNGVPLDENHKILLENK